MTVLRSREVVSATKTGGPPQPVGNGVGIEPSTPAKAVELTSKASYETTPNSDVIGSGCSPVSGQGLRRSARLSSKSTSSGVVANVSLRRRRKVMDIGNGEDRNGVNGVCSFALDGAEKDDGSGFEMARNNRRGPRVFGTVGGGGGDDNLVSDLGAKEYGSEGKRSAGKAKGKRRVTFDVEVSGSESLGDGDIGKQSLKTLLKSGVSDDDEKMLVCDNGQKGDDLDSEAVTDEHGERGLMMQAKRGYENCNKKARRRFSREDKGKGIAVDGIVSGESGLERRSDTAASEEMEIVTRDEVNGTSKRGRTRLSMEEKGKGKVVEADSSTNVSDMVTASLEPATNERTDANTTRDYRERFKDIARKNASRFAYFSVEEEEDPLVDDAEHELSQEEAKEDVEDWPGPFSTAMKIIKDRGVNMRAQQPNVSLDKNHSVPLVWIPKKDKQGDCFMKEAPSLQELCMTILAKNVDAISSLDSVPDVIRHKLTQMLCDCRKMNVHFFDLLASGSPSEIRVRDCSWLTEEQFTKTFERTDTSKLTVLQLDQCGRCLPDYALYATLSHSPNKLSSLTSISLKGACRLSDAGLNVLVASAPALRSINLGSCSLLTSDGIINLADKLGSVLKELYMDECFNVDAMRILPALLKLEHLEVLSLSRSETVCDSFIKQFVAVQGQKMKELVLADCTKLTDKSLKAIAESCPGLCAIDLTNLCKLTDSAIGNLANGCQTIQTMRLRCNVFSDEAVAAYLEACGESLKELSLNHVDKVSNYTALSLAKRSRNLLSLDLSWCRNMSNEALGLIVDSCLSLKTLKLFGCTQITNIFTDGHSNQRVKIIGLKTSQILKNIEAPDLLPLRYSSA